MLHYYEDKYEVFSAGTKPSVVNKNAIKVMKEIGIDISGQKSKHVNEFINQTFDIIITVCDNAKEACPVFLGKVFREVRNQIKDKITDYFN